MSKTSSRPNFALYHMRHCPYCIATRRAIDKLGLDIELRDTLTNPSHRQALIKHGGKHQVPCLRIENSQGEITWLYESQDIIQYLRNYHGCHADTAA